MTNAALKGKPDAGNPHVAPKKQTALMWARGSLVLLTMMTTSLAAAETLTWCGDGSGLFSSSANWTGGTNHTVPEVGDTAVFPSGKTVSLQAETVTLGAGTLTIEVNGALKAYNNFAGEASIVKKGSGTWFGEANSDFTGGLRVENGRISMDEKNVPYCFGHGEIELVKSSSNYPYFDFGDQWSRSITADFRITGGGVTGDTGSIYAHNAAALNGTVTSDGDLTIHQRYASLALNGRISAPGHTVTLSHNGRFGKDSPFKCNKEIDANVIVKTFTWQNSSQGMVTMAVGTSKPENSLTIESGTNTLEKTARWAGTNVTVKAGGARLVLTTSTNLTVGTTLRVATGGIVELGDFSIFVRRFVVNGVVQKAGAYGRSNCSVIRGTGVINCGDETSEVLSWKPSVASGRFSDAANWTSDGSHAAPQPGDICVFPARAVTLESETFDLAAGTVTTLYAPRLLNVHTVFTGAGGLVKGGAGEFSSYDKSTFSGGFDVRDGTLSWGNQYDVSARDNNRFGSGKITLRRLSPTSVECPRLCYSRWGFSTTNEIEIVNGLTDSYGSIYAGNPAACKGSVTSDSDFAAMCWFKALTLYGVSAPGHTVTLRHNAYDGEAIKCNGAINASVRTECYLDSNHKLKVGAVTFNAKNVGIDHKLTMGASVTNTFTSVASWAGTNVVMEAGAVACLKGARNLSENATLTLANGAKIDLAAGVKVRVAKFVLGGVVQPNGVYSASNLPAVLTGKGRLAVGPTPGLILLFK